MTVDFVRTKATGFRAATAPWKTGWEEKKVRAELERLARWAKGQGLPTGRWVVTSKGAGQWQAAVEVRGRARGGDGVTVRNFPASSVVRVTFDPDAVSARVVYHGLTDHLRWQKKEKAVKKIGNYREVYDGNPWTDAKAWAKTRVEALVA